MRFRVWDKTHNKYDTGNISLQQNGRLSIGVITINENDYEVEFNTGVTLADGTETFYDDIIRWKDSMFDSKGGDRYRYWILEPERMRLPWVWTDLVEENRFRKDIELVGNIHETYLTDAMKLWIKEK